MKQRDNFPFESFSPRIDDDNQRPAASVAEIRAYQRQLRRLASELSLTEARERREIASDLHDHIGQALAYVSQKVSTLQGNAMFSGFEDDLSEILSILSQTINYTRNLTVEISPPVLYELGLTAAIDWLAERAEERHNLKIAVRQSGRSREVADDIAVFIFKAIQELINNVVKHAGATKVGIVTLWKAEGIEVTVSDNGRGFDSSCVDRKMSDMDCFGLFSIRERLSYIGGTLQIDSTPSQGTKVSLSTGYKIAGEDEHD